MKWIKLFTIVISCGYLEVFSQDLSQTFQFGLNQFAQGNWTVAEKTLKRVLFFDSNNTYRIACLEKLAIISLEAGDLQTTLNYLDQSYFLTNDPNQKINLQLQRIRIFIEMEEYQKALAELYQIDPESNAQRLALYEGYCQYMLRDFEGAKTAFMPLCQSDSKRQILEKFLNESEKIEKINPKTYQLLSYFFPGLGQMLLGDAKNSLNSIMLNGALALLFIDTARKLSLFDATLSVVPWLYRYYTGGSKVARDLAIKKKEKKHGENLKKFIESLNPVIP